MKKNNDRYPEPPELRAMGEPPLLKELHFILFAFATLFIIGVVFMLIFKLQNG